MSKCSSSESTVSGAMPGRSASGSSESEVSGSSESEVSGSPASGAAVTESPGGKEPSRPGPGPRERRLHAIVEHMPVFLSTSEPDGTITYFNKTGREWLGLEGDEQPQGWTLRPAAMATVRKAAELGVWQEEREQFLHGRAGAKPDRTVLQTVKAHKNPDDEVEFYTTVAVDITEQKRLERERLHLLSIIEETPAFVATADAGGNVIYYNRAAREMLGMTPDEDARSVRIRETHPEWAARIVFEEGLPGAVRDGQWQGETAILTRDGREIPVLQVIVAHKDGAGEVLYYSTIVQDITDRKLMEERLHYLATHDALTGLINRNRFQQLLQEKLVEAKRTGESGAVLHLDLDNFKDVNDSLGHHIGDRLLRRLARLLQEQLREGDCLARLGGDEFALLLPCTDVETAVTVGEQVLQAVGEEVVLLDDKMIRMRASVGVATFPEEASKVEDVLIHADLSMYTAKRQGGQRLSVYDMGAEGRFRAESRLNLERLCREAVQRQLFVLHWQPLLHLQTGATAAYELLLRLRGEDGRLIPPLQFLPVCERSDIIHEVDRWVIGEAIKLAAALESAGAPRVDLHVNLSQRTLSDEELVPFVCQRLQETGADGSRIVLELTETAAVENVNTAAEFIRALRKLGLRFALDDFGVGFSNLRALRHLPVDYLKIDGSFIKSLVRDPVDQHLVKAVAEVARGLGTRTVAEFVPDEDTVRLLIDYGIELGQGFFLGKPQPVGLP